MVVASAPGKVILFGEHGVVYKGGKAIAAAINQRSYASVERRGDGHVLIQSDLGISREPVDKAVGLANEFDSAVEASRKTGDYAPLRSLYESEPMRLGPAKMIAGRVARDEKVYDGFTIHINTRVPSGCHRGTSSSVGAAEAGGLLACLDRFDVRRVDELAYAADRMIVGSPSGIDSTVVTYGGVVTFTKGEEPKQMNIPSLHANGGLHLAVADTGVRVDTGKMVALVRRTLNERPEKGRLIGEMNRIVEEGVDVLKSYDLSRAGLLMNHNQWILRSLGVSIPRIEDACSIALRAGAYGAKLTGAGGGGSVIALAEHPERIVETWRTHGFDADVVACGAENGVRVENGLRRSMF
ncbi:MAG: mevalonate kinase [Candidatus Aenigmarchaeota archaeon]|nr:mevalonate kinase [Candidatus Aenigmarchaeota archaeon]